MKFTEMDGSSDKSVYRIVSPNLELHLMNKVTLARSFRLNPAVYY